MPRAYGRAAMAPAAPDRLSASDLEAVVRRSSRALHRLLTADERARGVLSNPESREPLPTTREEVVGWQQRELLRIAARDLVGIDDLVTTTTQLSAMAADVLRVAVELHTGEGDEIAVIGMGKLGAGELNYSSDIDVMIVGGDPRTAKNILDVARQCFRVDAALRPEGRDGPLTRSLASYEAYWEKWASHWEFQALLKARALAGDEALQARFDEAAHRALWSKRFDASALRELRDLKARTESLLEQRGLTRREIKRGRGGIRDIEFAVQLLQLVHGGEDPTLRTPTTLGALAALSDGGYVDPADAEALGAAYSFLRAVEHRLQLVDLQQVHELPDTEEGTDALARSMGYGDVVGASAAEQFETELSRHRSAARNLHERLYFRPLLEDFAGRSPLPAEVAATRLSAFGFTDVERTRSAITELSRGLRRSSRLMAQLLPLLLEWLSDSPDPDLGLLGLRALASPGHGSRQLTAAFRDSPETARRLCRLLGTSPLMRAGFERQPQLIGDLGSSPPLRSPGRRSLEGRARADWHDGPERRRAALRQLRDEEVARVGARHILGFDTVATTAAALTDLAEVVLDAALEALEPEVPMAVIGMGRLGGRELGFASDLDVMFVHSGSGPKAAAEAERVASELVRFVNGPTPAERIFELDARLRPEGKQGPLARSLDGYAAYWQRWAQTWERQALLRARPCAGDSEAAELFMSAASEFIGSELSAEETRELRRIKARVEGERVPAAEDPQYHLKLGPGALADVEWTVQLLQLRTGGRGASTLDALERLRAENHLDGPDADVLAESYRFCEQVRNRLFLVKGGPGSSLPADPRLLSVLARSLETTPAGLREDYKRLTRRAREVVTRVFYGR